MNLRIRPRWIIVCHVIAALIMVQRVLSLPEPPPPDSDQDGLPDVWEMRYFGNLSQGANDDPDGDGLSNWQEYWNGSDPTDYYNGRLPCLNILSKTNQTMRSGNYLIFPLGGEALNTNGVGLINAPLTFTVTSGNARLSTASNGVLVTSLPMRTAANGQATAWLFLPTNSVATNYLTVTAASGSAQIQAQLAAWVGNVTNKDLYLRKLAVEPPFPGPPSVTLFWQNYEQMEHCRVEASSSFWPPTGYTTNLFLVIKGITQSTGVVAGARIHIALSNAAPGAAYDLYFKPQLSTNWPWRCIYSGAPGQTNFMFPLPIATQGYFVALDAKDTDNDGLSDGYEAWFAYNGQKTNPNDPESDRDRLFDNWEVEYGLNPTVTNSVDGASGDPDGDGLSNKAEHDTYQTNSLTVAARYDPLKNINTQPSRPVITISATDPVGNDAGDTAVFTIRRYVGNGSLTNALVVYYAIGGNLVYGRDYTLNPEPRAQDFPRVYSVEIPAGQETIDLTVTGVPGAIGLETEMIIMTVVPYGSAQ